MFTANVDLDRYCARLGYAGPREPNRATLAALLEAHPAAIPFENLNPLLGWAVRLEPDALQRKLLDEGRGGYCYEHNLLLGHVLTAMGFDVSTLAARVHWNVPAAELRPRTHLALRVVLDGIPYLVDAGFGGPGPTGPLRLEPDTTQPTPHDRYRLVHDGGTWRLDVDLPSGWTALYGFAPEPSPMVDCEVGNWYVSTHPRSIFVTTLMAARSVPGRRVTLRNQDLTIRGTDGRVSHRQLGGPAEIRAVLTETFGVRVPDAPGLDDALARVCAGGASQAR